MTPPRRQIVRVRPNAHDQAFVRGTPNLRSGSDNRTVQMFAGRDVAVVLGRTDFRRVETGETMHSVTSGIVFRLRDKRVVSLAPHDDLASALADADLDEHDHTVPV